MKRKTKIILAIGALILVGLVIIGVRVFSSFQKYQAAVSDVVFEHMDASGLADGVYTGEYDATIVYAKVEVTVRDEKIADINILEHRNGRGASAEGIVAEIVSRQRLDVDEVSGATNSSTVLKKAVDNALTSAGVL